VNLSESELSLSLENPFCYRGGIQDPRYFCGRVEETRQALQMLRNGQCVSIVGPRSIGKTSLLFHLLNPDVLKGHSMGKEFLFIYIDCQGLGALDESQIYQWLWQETQCVLADRGVTSDRVEEPSSFREFRDAILSIQNQKKGDKLVFLLDEFESIAQNPNLNQDLFSNLRSLATAVVYVTASRNSLFDLVYADRSVLSSPFFNIFQEIHLGLLMPGEAREMVSQLLKIGKQETFFTEEDIAFVFEIAGYHPFFLQLACYCLFERKGERAKLEKEDYESILEAYAAEAGPHFRYIWEQLDPKEREAVRAVSKGKFDQLDNRLARKLERECILSDRVFFSPVFAEFVQHQDELAHPDEFAHAAPAKQPAIPIVAIVRASALIATFGLVVGWFSIQVSSSIAAFFAGGLLLIALSILVISWLRRA
jgi:hypothetical protein